MEKYVNLSEVIDKLKKLADEIYNRGKFECNCDTIHSDMVDSLIEEIKKENCNE